MVSFRCKLDQALSDESEWQQKQVLKYRQLNALRFELGESQSVLLLVSSVLLSLYGLVALMLTRLLWLYTKSAFTVFSLELFYLMLLLVWLLLIVACCCHCRHLSQTLQPATKALVLSRKQGDWFIAEERIEDVHLFARTPFAYILLLRQTNHKCMPLLITRRRMHADDFRLLSACFSA